LRLDPRQLHAAGAGRLNRSRVDCILDMGTSALNACRSGDGPAGLHYFGQVGVPRPPHEASRRAMRGEMWGARRNGNGAPPIRGFGQNKAIPPGAVGGGRPVDHKEPKLVDAAVRCARNRIDAACFGAAPGPALPGAGITEPDIGFVPRKRSDAMKLMATRTIITRPFARRCRQASGSNRRHG
jgi:hypothetical protein